MLGEGGGFSAHEISLRVTVTCIGYVYVHPRVNAYFSQLCTLDLHFVVSCGARSRVCNVNYCRTLLCTLCLAFVFVLLK